MLGVHLSVGSSRVTSGGPVSLWTVAEQDWAPERRAEHEPPPLLKEPVAARAALPNRPLDGAFQPKPFGATLGTHYLNEESEEAVLRHAGRPTLVAYRRFDPAAQPVILVHGLNGSGSEMTALADRLTDAGRQVYVFQYHDNSSRLATSAEHLAREIRTLHAGSAFRDQPLDIVAHSMGGIVTRLAFNRLQAEGMPRAGFPGVQVHTLDTPLAGGVHESRWTRWLGAEAGSFVGLALARRLALHDMRATSAMFEGLYATRLDRVAFSNTAARQQGDSPIAPSVGDFSEVDRSEIASYLVHGVVPTNPRAANYARGLEQDVNGERLRERLVEESEYKLFSEALLAAYEAVMPSVPTDHVAIIADPASPAVLRLVELLTPRADQNKRGDV